MEALRAKLLAQRQARLPANESSFEAASISSDDDEVNEDLVQPTIAVRKAYKPEPAHSHNEHSTDDSDNVREYTFECG